MPRSMERDAALFAGPELTIEVPEFETPGNPHLLYKCRTKEFTFAIGGRIFDIITKSADSTYQVFKFDGKRVVEKLRQASAGTRALTGVDLITLEFKGKPDIDITSYEWDTKKSLLQLGQTGNNSMISRILDHKIFEYSVVSADDSVYFKWVFEKPPAELKASGQLDQACEMMLGKGYITVPTAKK